MPPSDLTSVEARVLNTPVEIAPAVAPLVAPIPSIEGDRGPMLGAADPLRAIVGIHNAANQDLLAGLVFGKSAALRWFAPRLRTATVPAFLTTSVVTWREDREGFLLSCRRRFGNQFVAVRSDAHVEDRPNASRAGEFLSVLGVQSDGLARAIDQVTGSLPGCPEDRVMVQAMVKRIRFAGVASTHRVADGAPWYCVDVASQGSAAVTSGRASGRQIAVARSSAQDAKTLQLLKGPVRPALNVLMEVERLADHRPLEIEFVLGAGENGALQAFLLQARPITTVARWHTATSAPPRRLPSLDFLQEPDPLPDIVGRRTLLSLMSDWNPAELIGTHPRPLSLSLFERLIARGVWWQARAQLGYKDVPGPDVELLRVLRGRPLVDLRRSANSLLPRELPAAIGQRLVDGWIARLADQPELHDKVEFQVYRTVRDFTAADELRNDWAPWLEEKTRQQWEDALGNLSRSIVAMGPSSPLAGYLATITRLEYESTTGRLWPELLASCKQGTLAFAALARIAFAAEAQLRSAVRRNALTPERAIALRAAGRSTPVQQPASMDTASFMMHHGHLRPGTFDITQRTWADSVYQPVGRPTETPAPFALRGTERHALQSLIEEAGISLCPDAWVQFVQQSASARERGKFVFSRHLSVAMNGIADMLAQAGLGRDSASWLTVAQLLQGQDLEASERVSYWRRHASDAQARHDAEAMLIVSPVVRSPMDRVVADSLGTLPNFVGQHVIEGPIVLLEDAQARPEAALRGAIVLLRQADPGFDWLFACGIVGLITAWGGANSHMAIRCAEFGLSAAIGCGDAVFAQAALAHHARIDPAIGALWLT